MDWSLMVLYLGALILGGSDMVILVWELSCVDIILGLGCLGLYLSCLGWFVN
jgi:hypothetical protein